MVKELFLRLKQAYSVENLNKLSARIIMLYKNKDMDSLKEYAKRTDVDPDKGSMTKLFNQLIRLYHPDKYHYYQQDLKRCIAENDETELQRLSGILELLEYASSETKQDITLSEVYNNFDWSYGREDFDYYDDYNDYNEDNEDDLWSIDENYNILTAIKQKEYGNLNVNFSLETFEQIEGELEVSGLGIRDLTGLENCINITVLDLSHNEITDISAVSRLKGLRELYLSDNYIEDVSALEDLPHLKVLDISANDISDISLLLELPELTYINILGIKVPSEQIAELKKKGITVVSE